MLTVFVTMALCPLKSAHPAQKELNPTTILSKTQTDAALPIVLPPPSSHRAAPPHHRNGHDPEPDRQDRLSEYPRNRR